VVLSAQEPPLADAPLNPPPAPASPLAALGRATDRSAQRAALQRLLAEEEARRSPPSAPPDQERASSLRLRALLALQPLLELPESPLPPGRATPGARERLVVELSDHLATGGGRAALQARWRADLSAHNPGAAAHPGFAPFADDLEVLPALAEALRDLARAARAKRPPPAGALGALDVAAAALAPDRWSGLHGGAPTAWLAALLTARFEPGSYARLAAECDAALEAAGRLRESQQSPTWELAALASAVYSRVCGALALCEELSST
jgi:hypothetical protein